MSESEIEEEKIRSEIEQGIQTLFEPKNQGWKTIPLPMKTSTWISPLTGDGFVEIMFKPPDQIIGLDLIDLNGQIREVHFLVLETGKEARIISHISSIEPDVNNIRSFIGKLYNQGEPARLPHLLEFKRILRLISK